jgi:hypothetical protein
VTRFFRSPANELEHVTEQARLLLLNAGVGDRLPTPVSEIVTFANLVISQDITLSELPRSFFGRSMEHLFSALQKAKGLIDLRDNVIYLDSLKSPKQRAFVKLHEVGHKLLPWQREAYLYLDDDSTLDPDVKELFEREANHFASEVLFQGERFSREAQDLPISAKSAIHLSKRYGSSIHAAMRRFVRTNRRSCALLVIQREPDAETGRTLLRVRSAEESARFTRMTGGGGWPEYLSQDCPAAPFIYSGRKLVEDGRWDVEVASGRVVECAFHYFDSSWNGFLLIYPLSEKASTRTKIILSP